MKQTKAELLMLIEQNKVVYEKEKAERVRMEEKFVAADAMRLMLETELRAWKLLCGSLVNNPNNPFILEYKDGSLPNIQV